MMRQEFEKRVEEIVGKAVYVKPSDHEWEAINTVYQFHPVIKDVGGQQQIANIYVNLGMTVIYDMVARAKRFAWHEECLAKAQAEVDRVKRLMKADLDGRVTK
jgi:hypothetical protein